MRLPTRQKIGLFCNVPTERVLSLYDAPTLTLPLTLTYQGADCSSIVGVTLDTVLAGGLSLQLPVVRA